MDTHTFSQAFEDYSDELLRHCLLRVRDRERALELVQESFTRTWEYIQKGNQVEQVRPFLYRTLRHLIIDEYRKKKSVSLEAIAEANEMESESLMPADESNTLEAAIDRHEGKRALEALKELPDLYREAVSLRYIEGLSPSEIADILDESENVVSVRVHRGLKKLRDILDHDA
jgi:RNA polymerase sigma-70 factor (ECF subfamily)